MTDKRVNLITSYNIPIESKWRIKKLKRRYNKLRYTKGDAKYLKIKTYKEF